MMPDREKVIKGLECCQPPYDCHNCPYDWDYCFMKNQLHKDALDLLKEQDETIKKQQEEIEDWIEAYEQY